MTTSSNPAFVFIHGSWHNHQTWNKIVGILAEKEFASLAIDLPGAGANAALPASFNQRPLDPSLFGTEPSPNAVVTQDERTTAVLAAVQMAKTMGNGKVILVGHSLGGLTLSHVGEEAPNQLHALVYLSAFMLPRAMNAGEFRGSEPMSTALVASLLMADPAVVGAFRCDAASTDPEYIAKMREVFYADVTDEDFAFIRSQLHPDEPTQISGVPSPITANKFGSVSRHFIRCLQDKAVTIAGQNDMISRVDEQMKNQTNVHTLDASHSPFLSMPEALCEILFTAAK